MRTRTHNGLTELVPSVAERHDELLREHAFPLLRRLLERIERLEETLLVTPDPAATEALSLIDDDLRSIQEANADLDQDENGKE